MRAIKYTEADKLALRIINDNANGALRSILYDFDLLPEQLRRHSKKWFYMMAIAAAFEAGTAVNKNKSKES
jgi:hypothetical protein